MNRLHKLVLLSLIFLASASFAQEGTPQIQRTPVTYGDHGGIIIASNNNMNFEYLEKKGAILVTPIMDRSQDSDYGKAVFTVTDNGKTIIIKNVEFINGFYTAKIAQPLKHPHVKFETILKGESYVANMEMPNKK